MNARIIQGDVLDRLRELPDESVHCAVTSPPYWGLRDYGVDGQIGLEASPQEFVAKLVSVFREVRRVLRKDGTAWVNMGDSYARTGGEPGGGNREPMHLEGKQKRCLVTPIGLKPKDLCGIPWRLAFALQDDGWWLRQDIIWSKPNPMPESVTDRCTKAHEYIFLLAKSAQYFYDAEAIKEKTTNDEGSRRVFRGGGGYTKGQSFMNNGPSSAGVSNDGLDLGIRNRRSVWNVATQPFPEAHFATFPEELITPCVLAGCPISGTVLDPFSGSGTSGVVALRYHRNYIGIELNPKYAAMSERRISDAAPLFNEITA